MLLRRAVNNLLFYDKTHLKLYKILPSHIIIIATVCFIGVIFYLFSNNNFILYLSLSLLIIIYAMYTILKVKNSRLEIYIDKILVSNFIGKKRLFNIVKGNTKLVVDYSVDHLHSGLRLKFFTNNNVILCKYVILEFLHDENEKKQQRVNLAKTMKSLDIKIEDPEEVLTPFQVK